MAEPTRPAAPQPAQPPAKTHAEHAKEHRGAVTPGAATTYGSPPPPAEPVKPVALNHDEIKSLIGDIHPGEIGHIKLDEEGNPTGAAFRDIPKGDDVTAAVYGNPAVQFDDLVTPSGAPITKQMNPEPKLWDAGMLARNPPPEPTERQKRFSQPGAVNTPVTV